MFIMQKRAGGVAAEWPQTPLCIFQAKGMECAKTWGHGKRMAVPEP